MIQVLMNLLNHVAYPLVLSTTGATLFIATSSIAVVGMDEAWQLTESFSSFGPFAQLFVVSLIMCVGGIVWWARMTERRLIEHRRRNDELLGELLARTSDTEKVSHKKDKLIMELVERMRKLEENGNI